MLNALICLFVLAFVATAVVAVTYLVESAIDHNSPRVLISKPPVIETAITYSDIWDNAHASFESISQLHS